MDAEDERDPKRIGSHLYERFHDRKGLELRLYETEEVAASDRRGDKVAYYRLRRFYDSLIGFHEVSGFFRCCYE